MVAAKDIQYHKESLRYHERRLPEIDAKIAALKEEKAYHEAMIMFHSHEAKDD